MNNSVSTMSGKTKLKIVLLGNQSVGKSSIIEKYVKDSFDETSNVDNLLFSRLWESIS
jgi:GTPase SAR1 family protein